MQRMYTRPPFESIFLQIARDAVEDAEVHETEYRSSQSLQAELGMQDRAMTAIVLLVQALEAFINVEGYHRLSPNLWKAVEPMKIKAKWSVVTRLTSGQEWEEDRQPFQDFAQLIRIRNQLVHYKPRYESTEGTFRTGTDFQDRFTGQTARRFFDCVCRMFEGFYAKLGEELPDRVQPGARSRGIILTIDDQQDDVDDEN